jgi:L-gulonolactone oxidase
MRSRRPPSPPDPPQVNVHKRYVVAEAGITLDALHAQLAKHGLAMINVGSISDQTLGGIVTTATHGTGINYGVISTHVIALSLLLADGTRVSCSRQERPDLFLASTCGLGSTGLILSVTLQVEPAFRLRETQQTLAFHQCLQHIDAIARAAQHVRIWWFPAADTMRVSSADRTLEVSGPSSRKAPSPSYPSDLIWSSQRAQPQAGSGIPFWVSTCFSSSFFWAATFSP